MVLAPVAKLSPSFTDERGEIINISEGLLRHVSVIRSKKGSVRGNHFHMEDTQYLYMLSGKVESTVEDVRTHEYEQRVLEGGDIEICPPGIAHRYVYLEDTVQLQISTAPRIAMGHSDTFKYEIKALSFHAPNLDVH